MIKIIKPGIIKTEYHYQQICKKCSCVFDYASQDYTHFVGERPYIACPCCNEKLFVSESKVVEYVFYSNGDVEIRGGYSE